MANRTTIEGLKEKRAALIEELKAISLLSGFYKIDMPDETGMPNGRETAATTKHLICNIAEINAIIYTPEIDGNNS
jgi:hypothetical protein